MHIFRGSHGRAILVLQEICNFEAKGAASLIIDLSIKSVKYHSLQFVTLSNLLKSVFA